jgi:glycosyltransferase involved in cell wall biosynthesis
MEAEIKKLLVVSWAMPPFVLPRSIQVARTLKCLAEAGWHTTVISVSPHSLIKIQKDSFLDRRYTPYFRRINVSSPEEHWMWRALWHFFPILSLLPDPQRVWMNRALCAARKFLANEKFSAMISFAQPWSNHLIGLQIHRESGLPWVAHFSDPWVDNPYYHYTPFQRRFCSRLEKAVIQEADAVVFVTSQAADLVMKKYPSAWRSKVHRMPHGYELEILNDVEVFSEAHRRLRLVHTGNFYHALRTPEKLLEALRLMRKTQPLDDQIEVVFIGLNTERYQQTANNMGLQGIVECRGPGLFLESLKAAAQADVLLLIDAPSDNTSPFLPSKVVDYLVFRKPILGLTPLSGASADLLRQLGCPIVSPDDIWGIAEVIKDLLKLWQSNRLKVSGVFDRVAKTYDIRQTTQTLKNVLDRYA